MRSSVISFLALPLFCVYGSLCALAEGAPDRGYAFLAGRVLSYTWLLNDAPAGVSDVRLFQNASYTVPYVVDLKRTWPATATPTGGFYDHGLGNWGAAYDAMLSVGLRSKPDSYGVVYGADFALAMPASSLDRALYDKLVGRGSRIFANTPYGSFSLGYQEGVESSMKVDVLGSVPGDSGGSWGKYLRYFSRRSVGMPFHVYPGLYSENLFRSMGSLGNVGILPGRSRAFFDVLPLRASYFSPKINGVSLGISYSPSGYADDLFKTGTLASHAQRNPTSQCCCSVSESLVLVGVKPRFDLGAVYKNLLSGALRYDVEVEGKVRLSAAVTGEYARSKRAAQFFNNISHGGSGRPAVGDFRLEYDNLAALSAGVELFYNAGFRAALTYGYLGFSGRPSSYSYCGGCSTPSPSTSPSTHELHSGRVPYLKDLPSYYFASSLGYGYGPLYTSLTYFMSRVGFNSFVVADYGSSAVAKTGITPISALDGENILKDLSIGLDYVVYKKKDSRLGVFANCHVFSIKQRTNGHYVVSGATGAASSGQSYPYHPTKYHTMTNSHHGVVVMSGVKFDF